jgi:acid phosphatase (class A)
LAVALAITTVVCAQEPELKVKPSGRILFDAAYINSSHQEDELKSGVGIPDMRVGVGFTYDNICTLPKRYYMRKRPFMRFNEPTLYPADEPALRKNGSYPSGHTLLGWSSALLLSEINPDRADTILARGLMYGDSRIIVGAHWQSDVNAARLAASAAYARLHTSERFLEQMRLARQEFRVKAGLATIVEMKAYKKAAAKRAKSK